MSDYFQVKVSNDVAPTRDRRRLRIRVEMRRDREKPDCLSLKECSEARSKCEAELGTVGGRTVGGLWTESRQVRLHSAETGPGPPHIPA